MHMCLRVHLYISTCMCACLYVCVYVCVSECVYTICVCESLVLWGHGKDIACPLQFQTAGPQLPSPLMKGTLPRGLCV